MLRLKATLKKIAPFWLIMKINQWRGISYEEDPAVAEKKSTFYKGFLKPGDLVFDVGANYGNRVSPFLAAGCRVVAVEPLPECCRYLRYRFGKQIRLENVCLGSSVGHADLFVGAGNVISTISQEFMRRTVESGRFSRESWGETLRIKVTTLDDLIKKYGTPRFIKIDTEGHEMEVIKGLSSKISLLSFEYTLPEFQSDLVSILNLLNQRGDMRINFAPGESMRWVLSDWMPLKEFENFLAVNKDSFGGWGDIYISFNTEKSA